MSTTLLSSEWERLTIENERADRGHLDIPGFVDRVIDTAAKDRYVEFSPVGADVRVVCGETGGVVPARRNALGVLRMVIARTVFVFGGADLDPPMLYEGTLRRRFAIAGSDVELELSFRNHPGDNGFRISRLPVH
jgi:hypothetical protein